MGAVLAKDSFLDRPNPHDPVLVLDRKHVRHERDQPMDRPLRRIGRDPNQEVHVIASNSSPNHARVTKRPAINLPCECSFHFQRHTSNPFIP